MNSIVVTDWWTIAAVIVAVWGGSLDGALVFFEWMLRTHEPTNEYDEPFEWLE